ncbi:hypothetical protein GN956_G17052 [Arapaima gigas]
MQPKHVQEHSSPDGCKGLLHKFTAGALHLPGMRHSKIQESQQLTVPGLQSNLACLKTNVEGPDGNSLPYSESHVNADHESTSAQRHLRPPADQYQLDSDD